MITPSSQYEQDLKTGKRVLLKQQEVLGGYNKDNYTTERLLPQQKTERKFQSPLFIKRVQKMGTTLFYSTLTVPMEVLWMPVSAAPD